MIKSRSESVCQYPLVDGKEGSKGRSGERRRVRQPYPEGTDPNARFRSVSLERSPERSEATRDSIQDRRGTVLARLASKKAVASLLFAGSIFAADPSTKARTITYVETDEIPRVYIGKGFETVIKLDKSEQVVFAATGITDFNPQFVGYTVILKFIGTATGQKTDMRILCASGNEYSFLIEEASIRRDIHPDLTVFVKNGDSEAQRAMIAPPKLFTADQVARMQDGEREARAALAKEREQRQSEVSKAALQELVNTKQDYEFFDRKGEDFHPSARHDDKTTVVDIKSQEVPSFFEVKEGKLSLIQANFANGHYVIPKVVDMAELKVGKSSVKFRRIG